MSRIARRKYHGKTESRLYGVWKGVKQRCNDPNHAHYDRYGGRGIMLCREWYDFGVFYDWAVQNGYDETAERGKCTIDRIDNNEGYSPENCRFVSMKEQYRNRDIPKTAAEYARERGLTPGAVHQRMGKRGMSLKEALEAPLRPRPRMLTYNGQTKSMSEWANELGMSLQTLSSRLYRDGLSVEEALSKPVRRRV